VTGVTEIELWKDHDVLGGIWWWTWETKKVPIKDCTKATLKGKVWMVGPVTCAIEVNGYRVWEQFEPVQGWYEIDMDITPYIRQYADNLFSIGVSPLGGATWTLSATIVWTETAPSPPAPAPEEEKEYQYLPTILTVGLVAVILAVVIWYATRRRER